MGVSSLKRTSADSGSVTAVAKSGKWHSRALEF